MPTSNQRSILWSFVMTGGQQVFAFASTLVVATLVGPEAFGTAVMGLVFVAFVQLLLQQGMSAAIIQREDLQPEHIDSVFWLVLAASAVLWAGSVAGSDAWARANDLPELGPVIRWLAWLVPLRGLVVVQDALLRRSMRFRALAVRTNGAGLAGGLVGIGMALQGMGVWSIVGQHLATGVVELAVLWAASRWRPRLRFSSPHLRDLMGFSIASFAASLGMFFVARADALIMGMFFGPTVVGLYRFAWRLVISPVDIIASSLQSVSFPQLSRHQNDPAGFAREALSTLALSARLSFPAMAILAVAGAPLLRVIGSDWVAAAPVLPFLCYEGAAMALTFISGPALQALGLPQRLAVLTWASGAVNVMALTAVGWWLSSYPAEDQLLGIAMLNALLFGGVLMAVQLAILFGISSVTARELASAVRTPAAVALLGLAIGFGLAALARWAGLGALLELLLAGGATALVSGGLLLAVDPPTRTLGARWLARLRRQPG